ARQAVLVDYFHGGRAKRWLFNPRIQRIIDACIEDQLDRFVALYGERPSHVDGHHHLHTVPNLPWSPAPPAGSADRRPLTFARHLPRPPTRAGTRLLGSEAARSRSRANVASTSGRLRGRRSSRVVRANECAR